jgi:cytochrome c oxidase subunit II
MKKLEYNLFLLFVVVILLAACGGDEAEDDSLMNGDEVGPGMIGDDADMMDEDASMVDEDELSGRGEGEMGGSGTAWGDGAFAGNGERIYFTATSERRGDIDYTGGPDIGGMMMGGQLSCASCHGPNARGGEHRMHMEIMDAPNIRWDALAEHGSEGHEEGEEAQAEEEAEHAEEDEHAAEGGGYDLETFRLAVVGGIHPNGEALSEDMPRWQMSDADLRDLVAYLQSLEGE